MSVDQLGPDSSLHDLYAEHDRLWKAYVSIPDEERREWSAKGYSRDTEASRLFQAMKQLGEWIHSKERPFESDLADALGERIQDESVARAAYAALCNVDWQHEDGSRYSCSWRYAGGLVADMRGLGEDYLDFYCSGNEGHVRDDIAEALAAYGWTGTHDSGDGL